ncbi:hypothetical protein AB2L57_10790 [Microbacterium sp. HA-8]|uniref:hypothetical protein n=1 Tax=Microbacterium sp. HA-8 TaxID=3234200 RepID=UPI0038F7D07F
MADMQEKASTTSPTVHPDEVLMDLRLGEAVTDRTLSIAATAATGRTRDRLWTEVMKRLTPAVRWVGRMDEVEGVSYLFEQAALLHDGSVAKSGGIESYSGWVNGYLGRGLSLDPPM